MLRSDRLPFFRAWLADPLRVASVTPSSPALARLISSEITAAVGPVLELGPGTGIFTQALIGRGVEETDLTLIESGEEFTAMLRVRFPNARVVQMDAGKLSHAKLFDGAYAGAVVSGLPLLSMSGKQVMSILSGAFGYLRPAGAFYQFTYGPRCPVSRIILDRLGLKATRIGATINNFPPAAVYRITRRGPMAISQRSETHQEI